MTDPFDDLRARLSDLEPVNMGPVPEGSDDGWMPDAGGDAPDPGGPGVADPGAQAEDDPVARAALEPMNDVGNGQRFVIHFGPDCLYVAGVGWYVWAGTHWSRDEHQLAVRGLAQRLHPLIEEEVRHLQVPERDAANHALREEYRARIRDLQARPPEARTEAESGELRGLIAAVGDLDRALDGWDKSIARRITFAKDSGNSGRIDKLMQEASVRLAVPFAALDADPLEVNCASGLLRFRVADVGDGGGKVADVQLVPHDRSQRVTKIVPVAWNPSAKAPLWEAFLARIQPDREMRAFLQRWLGLSMSALKTSNLAFFYGSGANGKSVLVDTIARVLSGYAAGLKIESITGTNRRGGAEATPDLVPLMGARFVRTSEPDQGTPLQEGLIKQMTGGEPIQVRPMYGAQIDLDPTWKITMSGNHKPDIRGTDDGIWRRLLLVEFDVQIPAAERDERLGEKLWAEREGIFAWLVDGLLAYLEGGLAPPASVRDATAEYREESDPLGTFLTSCCAITGDPADSILSSRLVTAVNYHFFERGLNGWKPATITRQMAVKSRQWKHPVTGRRFEKSKASVSQYIGLRLTDDFARRFDSAPKDSRGEPVGVGEDASAPHPGSDF